MSFGTDLFREFLEFSKKLQEIKLKCDATVIICSFDEQV